MTCVNDDSENDFDTIIEKNQLKHFNETPCKCYVAFRCYGDVAIGPFMSKEEIIKWRAAQEEDYMWQMLPCEGESDLNGTEIIFYMQNLSMVSAGAWIYSNAYGPYVNAEEHKKSITVDEHDSLVIKRIMPQ